MKYTENLAGEQVQLNPKKERVRALEKAKEIEAKRGKKPIFLKKGESRDLEFLNKKRRGIAIKNYDRARTTTRRRNGNQKSTTEVERSKRGFNNEIPFKT